MLPTPPLRGKCCVLAEKALLVLLYVSSCVPIKEWRDRLFKWWKALYVLALVAYAAYDAPKKFNSDAVMRAA
eukprot:11666919-Karenia_brevis.AAC.1